MSHGPSGGGDTIEPNLTPLLDLVLQLLMLFMICGNYASESNDPVELAKSATAQQLTDTDKTQPGADQDFLFITLKPYHNADGVKDLAIDEINNREREGMYSGDVGGHKLKVVDELYKKLLAKEPLDDEERSLLQELNIPADSEADLKAHTEQTKNPLYFQSFKDGDAYVVVPGQDAMKPDDSLLKWLSDQYTDIANRHNGQVNTPVVIRPDGNMDYAVVYRVLKLCKDAHFTTLKVRALIAKGVES